jgi:hypothetical protein
MSDDPSPALLKTCLNGDHATETPSTLRSDFLTLDCEEVRAWVQEKASEGFNTKIWNHMRDAQDEAVTQTKHRGSVRVLHAKLTRCWAFEASWKNRVNHDQALAICQNLTKLPDIKTITRSQAAPTDDGPPVAARTAQDKVDSAGPAQTANDKERASLSSKANLASDSDESVSSPSNAQGCDNVDVSDANSVCHGKKGVAKHDVEDKLELFARFELLVAKHADECNEVVREKVDKKETAAKSWQVPFHSFVFLVDLFLLLTLLLFCSGPSQEL